MNCKRAQVEIALMVGGDLDATEQAELRLHLAACHDCARYREQMLVGYDVLRAPVESSARSQGESIWPAVADRLKTRTAPRRVLRFSGWVPAATVVAACLLIAVLSSYKSGPQRTPILTQPVSSQPQGPAWNEPVWNPWIEGQVRQDRPQDRVGGDNQSPADKPVRVRLPQYELRNEF